MRWTYDLASRLVIYERALATGTSIDDFTSSITESMAYDAMHRLTQVQDDNFNATSYEYDPLGRSTKTTYADTKSITRTFDKNGNVSGWTDQNGTVVANTYDAVNRMYLRTVTQATGVVGTTQENFSYDALGRMLSAVDDDARVVMTYDSVGHMLTDKQGYNVTGSELWKTVTGTYSDAGALTALAYPNGLQIQHNRDAIYRLTSLVDAATSTAVTSFTWQGRGRKAGATHQNGTSAEYAYDGFRRLAAIDHLLSGGTTFHQLDYAYDKVHNRQMEQHSFDATWVGGLPTAIQAVLSARHGKGDVYAYDWAYRMVTATYDVTNPLSEVAVPGSQTYVKKQDFTLDGLGNRSQVQVTPWGGSASTTTYASDVVNQYTTIGTTSRTHDLNGNLTDDGSQKYVYDYKNRLCEVRDAANALIASYKYDALGRRIEKDIAGGATTRYILAGVSVIEEYDGSDTWQANYIHEDRIDHSVAMERADIADVDGDSNTAELMRFHYHQQALGSVTELTSRAGAVVEWVRYDAYGKATICDQNGAVVTKSAVGNPYLFTGRAWDDESGTYFYRARTYDPEAGRFLQRDPLGYVDGLAAHEYVGSSPVRFTDPSGERETSAEAITGAEAERDAQKIAEIKRELEARAAYEKRHAEAAGKLAEAAKDKVGSHAYDRNDGTAGGEKWRGQPKCNLFVHDRLEEVGLFVPMVPKPWVGGRRPPVAREWGDPEKKIGGYPVVKEPKPGDIVSDGRHVGIVTEAPDENGQGGSTASATEADGVTDGPFGLREGDSPTFRRPTP